MWPDNWPAFLVFDSLSTQWRSGQVGPTGLDYNVLRDIFQFNEIPPEDWPDTFMAIRIMEGAALEIIHKKD